MRSNRENAEICGKWSEIVGWNIRLIGETNFELIAQEILKQQRLMQELEAENQELRRQLADMRAGRGILIDVGGQRFTLSGQFMAFTEEAPFAHEEVSDVPETATPPV